MNKNFLPNDSIMNYITKTIIKYPIPSTILLTIIGICSIYFINFSIIDNETVFFNISLLLSILFVVVVLCISNFTDFGDKLFEERTTFTYGGLYSATYYQYRLYCDLYPKSNYKYWYPKY